jgi:exodeoxyribonuclease VIII
MFPIFADKSFKNSWLDCSTEEYRALPAANFSSIKNLLRSPAYYYAKKVRPSEVTESMRYGTIAHMALLEGEKFRNSYVVEPIFEGLTKDGKITNSKNSLEVKEKIASWRASLPDGSVILSQRDLDSLNGIIASLIQNEKILAAIKNGIPEAKGTWRDPDTGLQCKLMADLFMPQHGYLFDFKTTGHSSEWDTFRKSVENYNYDMQLAFYSDGIEAITGEAPRICGWVAVDTNDPYEIEMHLAHDLYLSVGRMKYKKCLKKLKQCLESGKWPQRQHESEFQMPEPSSWYLKSYEGVMNEY